MIKLTMTLEIPDAVAAKQGATLEMMREAFGPEAQRLRDEMDGCEVTLTVEGLPDRI